jgi:hypothetical protein
LISSPAKEFGLLLAAEAEELLVEKGLFAETLRDADAGSIQDGASGDFEQPQDNPEAKDSSD